MRGSVMTAKIYLEHKLVKKMPLSKDRKIRNSQIKEICKEYELKNKPCYVDITGGDIKR